MIGAGKFGGKFVSYKKHPLTMFYWDDAGKRLERIEQKLEKPEEDYVYTWRVRSGGADKNLDEINLKFDDGISFSWKAKTSYATMTYPRTVDSYAGFSLYKCDTPDFEHGLRS